MYPTDLLATENESISENFLFSSLEEITTLSEQDRLYLKNKVNLIKLRKLEHYIHLDDNEGPLGLVHSGILRVYSIDEKGRMRNIAFRREGEFCGVFSTLFTSFNHKSWFSIQAITDCIIFSFTQKDMIYLREKLECWDNLERFIFQNRYIEMENRINNLLTMDASENYKIFIKENKDIVDRISFYHIAEYLGINQVSLSRIRNEFNNVKKTD